jgi:hypothetical protein
MNDIVYNVTNEIYLDISNNITSNIVNNVTIQNEIINNITSNVYNDIVNNVTIFNDILNNITNNIYNDIASNITFSVVNNMSIVTNITNSITDNVTIEVINNVINNLNNTELIYLLNMTLQNEIDNRIYQDSLLQSQINTLNYTSYVLTQNVTQLFNLISSETNSRIANDSYILENMNKNYYGEMYDVTGHTLNLQTMNTFYNITNWTQGEYLGWILNTHTLKCNNSGMYQIIFNLNGAVTSSDFLTYRIMNNNVAISKGTMTYKYQLNQLTYTQITFLYRFNQNDTIHVQVSDITNNNKDLTITNKNIIITKVSD